MTLLDEALLNIGHPKSGPREMALDIVCEQLESPDVSSQWVQTDLLPLLLERSLESIGGPQGDTVYARTFAVEILATLIACDSKKSLLTPQQRQEILGLAVEYLDTEVDFRGFVDEVHGWAHGAAHIADLTLSIFESRYFDQASAKALILAWQRLLQSSRLPLLHYDEDQRMAMAFKAGMSFGRLSALDLSVFFDGLLNDEEDDWLYHAYQKIETHARLKNIQALARSLYLQLHLDPQTANNVDALAVLKGVLRHIDSAFYPAPAMS